MKNNIFNCMFDHNDQQLNVIEIDDEVYGRQLAFAIDEYVVHLDQVNLKLLKVVLDRILSDTVIGLNHDEAMRALYEGSVIRYIGTVNGNIKTDDGGVFRMSRGIVFSGEDGDFVEQQLVYDPDFRYQVLDYEEHDPNEWLGE